MKNPLIPFTTRDNNPIYINPDAVLMVGPTDTPFVTRIYLSQHQAQLVVGSTLEVINKLFPDPFTDPQATPIGNWYPMDRQAFINGVVRYIEINTGHPCRIDSAPDSQDRHLVHTNYRSHDGKIEILLSEKIN